MLSTVYGTAETEIIIIYTWKLACLFCQGSSVEAFSQFRQELGLVWVLLVPFPLAHHRLLVPLEATPVCAYGERRGARGVLRFPFSFSVFNHSHLPPHRGLSLHVPDRAPFGSSLMGS